MRSHQFQPDRSEALRRQLVELPALSATGDPLRDLAPPHTLQGEAPPSTPQHPGTSRDSGLNQIGQVTPLRHPHRGRRVLLATAAASVGMLVVGQLSVTVQSAHAAGLLRSAAEQSTAFVDPDPGPGQYLLVHKEGSWFGGYANEAGGTEAYMAEQRIDVYVPDDPEDEWVLDREWGAAGPHRAHAETIRAQDGEFYGGPWTAEWTEPELTALPRDGQALLDVFDAQYRGGSASRNEDNFVRITDLLKTGLVPADLRAGLYEALALIPGVDASKQQATLEGELGIAIGRTEPLRLGMRQEIIIDPDTGLVIGERSLMTWAAFGFGTNEIIGHTAIDYQIVDSAPE